MHDKSHPFWCSHSWVKCIKATFFRALLSDGPKKAILCSKRDHWCLLSDWGVNALGWHTSRRQSSNFYNAEWSVTLHCTLLNCWWKLNLTAASGPGERTNEAAGDGNRIHAYRQSCICSASSLSHTVHETHLCRMAANTHLRLMRDQLAMLESIA